MDLGVRLASVIGEKSALFAHARLPRFLWGTWKLLLYLSVLHDCTLLKHRSRLHLQNAALFNQGVPYALGKVGKPGILMVLRTNN